jgi:FixJ family two-component response regulator
MPKARLLIAVVDDERSVCTALKRLIRSAGMDVETYPSGEEFLQAMQTRQPDCIVLDLHMPKVTGFEVQSELAKSWPRLPVVVVTGHDTPESRARALAGRAAAYLLKPIDERMLLETIAGAIAKAGA